MASAQGAHGQSHPPQDAQGLKAPPCQRVCQADSPWPRMGENWGCRFKRAFPYMPILSPRRGSGRSSEGMTSPHVPGPVPKPQG